MTDALIDIGGVPLIAISKEKSGKKKKALKRSRKPELFHCCNPSDRPFPGHAKKKTKQNKTKQKNCPLVKFMAKVKELSIVTA